MMRPGMVPMFHGAPQPRGMMHMGTNPNLPNCASSFLSLVQYGRSDQAYLNGGGRYGPSLWNETV
jgi:hypothetical protein